MKKRKIVYLLSAFVIVSGSLFAEDSTVGASIVDLRAEMRTAPLGLNTPQPRLSWSMESPRRGARQTAYRICAATSPEALAGGRPDLWDTGWVESNQSHLVPYEGTPLTSRQRVYWRVSVRDETGVEHHAQSPAVFELALLKPEDWQAEWITGSFDPVAGPLTDTWVRHMKRTGAVLRDPNFQKGWPFVEEDIRATRPALRFRKTFEVDKSPETARLYIAGLGYHTVWINGCRVGDRVFDPAQRNYEDTVSYVVHDLAPLLREGTNVIAVEVTDGWFSPAVAKVGGDAYYDSPVLRAQLEWRQDGKIRSVVTDDSWTVGTGPRIKSDFYIGEIYDARLENDAWLTPDPSTGEWHPAEVISDFRPRGLKPMPSPPAMQAQQRPPERVIRSYDPESIREVKPGVWVFLFPHRLSGTLTLNPKGLPEGTTLVFRSGEYLHGSAGREARPVIGRYYEHLEGMTPQEDGGWHGDWRGMVDGTQWAWLHNRDRNRPYQLHVYPTSVYVADGTDRLWTTEYSHQPFLAIEVLGLPEGWTPGEHFLRANVVHTDIEKTATLSSSEPLLTAMEQMLWNSFLYNTHAFPMDNPGAERGGFPQEFTHIDSAYSVAFSDVAQVMREWIDDMMSKDAALGKPSITAPGKRLLLSFNNSAQVYFTLLHVWRHYLLTGDDEAVRLYGRRLAQRLETSWKKLDLAKGWTEFSWGDWGDVDTRMIGKATGHFPRKSNLPLNTPKEFTELARLRHAFLLMADMAARMGDGDLAAVSRERSEKIREAILQDFYDDAAGSFGSQTADAMALLWKLYPEGRRAEVEAALVRDVKIHQGRFTGGAMEGAGLIFEALSQISPEHAYQAITLPGFPGYRHMMETEPGAGTTWAMWSNSRRPDSADVFRLIQGSTPMHGLSYLYQDLGGIQPDPEVPAFKHVRFRPAIPETLESYGVSTQTPYGTLSSQWSKERNGLQWDVVVPPNTTATLDVPQWFHATTSVTEGGASVLAPGKVSESVPGVEVCRVEDGTFTLRLQSGTYAFFITDQSDTGSDEAAFRDADAGAWQRVFFDDCTGDWTEKWFLDGEVAKVSTSGEGMHLEAGPTPLEHAHHAVLWTEQEFEGDLKIEYDYTRTDEAIRMVNILYIQASGIGEDPYSRDIKDWRELRRIPYMSSYYKYMNLFHLSYAAFDVDNEDPEYQYIRGRRYMPERVKMGEGNALQPDYYPKDLFETGVPHHITVIKRDGKLYFRVENGEQTVCGVLGNPDLPDLTEPGRIGLRHMATRSARYKNFTVYSLEKKP